MLKQFSLLCPLPNGIHARPASQIAVFCQQFNAEVRWHNLRNDQLVDAKSVLGLISSDILFNDPIRIEVEGQDAQAASDQLQHFLEQVLPESDTATATPMHRTLPRSLVALSPSPTFGQPAGPGVAMGPLVCYFSKALPDPAHLPAAESLPKERQKLEAALHELTLTLHHQTKQTQEEAAGVARAHLVIVRDTSFRTRLEQALQPGRSSAHAVLETIHHYREKLKNSTSTYLRERELDMRDVGQQLLAQLLPNQVATTVHLPEGAILWAEDLTPSELLALPPQRLGALLLSRGGHTSHTVILARAFGLPVLTGICKSKPLIEGSLCIVDGNLGVMFLNPQTAIQHYYTEEIALQHAWRQKQQAISTEKTHNTEARWPELAVNIGSAVEAQLGFSQAAEGVGLFRTELLYMDRPELPDEEEQFAVYAEVVKQASGRSVIIRTFDIGGDKPAQCLPAPAEANPFLGYRAIRTYPDLLAIFRTQLRAILRAAMLGPVKIMIPMIATLEEIRWVKRVFHEMAESLNITQHIPLGIMLEVPSVLFQLDAFCKEVDFFSIGSNDLTQYLFAADRDNPQVASLYDGLHPAFLRALKMATDTVHAHGRWIGLCGELGASPQALPFLVGLGLDEISMGAPSLAESRARLRELDHHACQKLLEAALTCENGQQVRELAQSTTIQTTPPMLVQDCIIIDAPWQNKASAIKGLIDRLWLTGRCDDRFGMEEDVWLREEAYSTGLGFGCAIPHAKSAHVRHPTLCVARLKKPVDWNSPDGQPVDLVLMLIFHTRQAGALHLKFFSRLARQIMHEDFRNGLRQQPDEAAMLHFLQAHIDIPEELQV